MVGQADKVTAGFAVVAFGCTLVAMFMDVEVHQKFLTVFLYLLALIPISLTLIMGMVLMYAFYVVFTRRDSIRITLELKNKEIFESYGIKMSPSEDYEWIVAEFKGKKGGAGMVSKTLKIGSPKKDASGAPAKDTSQGLLGNLEGVDFD